MLHFEIKGNKNETLILLHGFMESTLIWDDMEAELTKNFTLLKIDLPGHGRSESYAEVHSMELMTEKVNEVVEYLKLKNFHLLGHSMGGYVSLAYAERYGEKIKSLTLFFSTFLADDAEKKEQRQKSLRIIKENFKAYVNAGVPNLFSAHERKNLEEKIDLAKEIALSTGIDGVLAAVKGMSLRADKKEVLENFIGKILLIQGNKDTAMNTQKTLQELPEKANIKSYVLDCGHNGHWEKPLVCAAILNSELV